MFNRRKRYWTGRLLPLLQLYHGEQPGDESRSTCGCANGEAPLYLRPCSTCGCAIGEAPLYLRVCRWCGPSACGRAAFIAPLCPRTRRGSSGLRTCCSPYQPAIFMAPLFPMGLLFCSTFGISATLADLGPWQPQILQQPLPLQCDFMGPLWYGTMADLSRMGAYA